MRKPFIVLLALLIASSAAGCSDFFGNNEGSGDNHGNKDEERTVEVTVDNVFQPRSFTTDSVDVCHSGEIKCPEENELNKTAKVGFEMGIDEEYLSINYQDATNYNYMTDDLLDMTMSKVTYKIERPEPAPNFLIPEFRFYLGPEDSSGWGTHGVQQNELLFKTPELPSDASEEQRTGVIELQPTEKQKAIIKTGRFKIYVRFTPKLPAGAPKPNDNDWSISLTFDTKLKLKRILKSE